MLHASGHDDHLAFTQYDGPVTEFHSELSLNHQEEFVFIFVCVPIELMICSGRLSTNHAGALKLREFDFLIVERSNDPG